METWVLVLIIVLVGAVVFLATRPRRMGAVWYDSLPVFYDRIPSFMHRGGSWSGRGGGGGHSGWGGGGHHGGRHH